MANNSEPIPRAPSLYTLEQKQIPPRRHLPQGLCLSILSFSSTHPTGGPPLHPLLRTHTHPSALSYTHVAFAGQSMTCGWRCCGTGRCTRRCCMPSMWPFECTPTTTRGAPKWRTCSSTWACRWRKANTASVRLLSQITSLHLDFLI